MPSPGLHSITWHYIQFQFLRQTMTNTLLHIQVCTRITFAKIPTYNNTRIYIYIVVENIWMWLCMLSMYAYTIDIDLAYLSQFSKIFANSEISSTCLASVCVKIRYFRGLWWDKVSSNGHSWVSNPLLLEKASMDPTRPLVWNRAANPQQLWRPSSRVLFETRLCTFTLKKEKQRESWS